MKTYELPEGESRLTLQRELTSLLSHQHIAISLRDVLSKVSALRIDITRHSEMGYDRLTPEQDLNLIEPDCKYDDSIISIWFTHTNSKNMVSHVNMFWEHSRNTWERFWRVQIMLGVGGTYRSYGANESDLCGEEDIPTFKAALEYVLKTVEKQVVN